MTICGQQLKKFGFPKSRKLLANSQFRYVLGRKAYAADRLVVIYAAANECGWPRLGISVSRSCGGAVLRNRLKRLIREAFRLNQDGIPQDCDYVAIGLAMLAAGEFRPLGSAGGELAIVVMNTIAAMTIFFEIIGPIGTRFAIGKAGDTGANVTEKDLIQAYSVSDVMDRKIRVLSAGASLTEIIKVVSDADCYYYPVTDGEKKLMGAVTLEGIRNTFSTRELNDWQVGLDIAEPTISSITAQMPLADAFEMARRLYLQHLPMVASEQDNTYLGVLNCQAVHRSLSAEVLSRQKKADSMHSASCG